MKRSVDEFEKKLIELGWKLHHKEYWGKNSESVLCYVYEKEFYFFRETFVNGFVRYRKVDKKILDVGFYNDNHLVPTINDFELTALQGTLNKVNEEVRNALYEAFYNPKVEENTEEVVEVVEALEEND